MINKLFGLPTFLTRESTSLDEKPLFPKMGEIRRVRKGSKVSRYFRHLFEHSGLKKFLGTNLAAFVLASSFIPHSPQVPVNLTFETEESITTETPFVFTTERKSQYPVDELRITQGYNKYLHPGIDLDGETGDPIYPVMEGFVESTEYSHFGYGNTIIVRHVDNTEALYAHLSKINVERGDLVQFDDIIGEMGSTGRSTGDHLHLEIRKDGKGVNPFSVLPQLN